MKFLILIFSILVSINVSAVNFGTPECNISISKNGQEQLRLNIIQPQFKKNLAVNKYQSGAYLYQYKVNGMTFWVQVQNLGERYGQEQSRTADGDYEQGEVILNSGITMGMFSTSMATENAKAMTPRPNLSLQKTERNNHIGASMNCSVLEQ